jgi:phenylpyruvate tautomerase PptA (4-oxalocrotonate tautomerase family)
MPLYTVFTEEGVLSREAKAALAMEITDFHCKLSGVDRNFVKIVFASFPRGNGFVGGEDTAPVALTVLIRAGRSADYKTKMATELWTMVQRATGALDPQMVVGIEELPASQAMEMGKIMPNV